MAGAEVKHDYHLVNPSPWPLVGSVAATMMMIGAVMWMKSGAGEAGLFFSAAFPKMRRVRLIPNGRPSKGWWLFADRLCRCVDHVCRLVA